MTSTNPVVCNALKAMNADARYKGEMYRLITQTPEFKRVASTEKPENVVHAFEKSFGSSIPSIKLATDFALTLAHKLLANPDEYVRFAIVKDRKPTWYKASEIDYDKDALAKNLANNMLARPYWVHSPNFKVKATGERGVQVLMKDLKWIGENIHRSYEAAMWDLTVEYAKKAHGRA